MSIQALAPEWLLHLEAENLSPKTLAAYRLGTTQLAAFLVKRNLPTDVRAIRPRDIEAFLIAKTAETSASTAATRYRGLRQFFRWLVAEGELEESPMAQLKPPKVPTEPVPFIADDVLRKLFKACDGRTYADRRDTAILRVLLNTGARVSEIANLRVEDVDFQDRELFVVGKGRKGRHLPISPKTLKALARYLRARAARADADSPALWLGLRGPMTDDGIRQMLRTRAERAGLEHIHPHQFRHTFSHLWLSDGGGEHDLAKLNGWASLQMVGRYTASAAIERAKEAHRRLQPGEHI